MKMQNKNTRLIKMLGFDIVKGLTIELKIIPMAKTTDKSNVRPEAKPFPLRPE
jgi:hypothetical protein